MAKKRILPGMSMMDSMKVIAGDSMKVYMLIVDIMTYLNENNMGSSGNHVDVLGCFDGAGMYGDDIYIFYNKIFKNNLGLFISLMKACRHDGSKQIDCIVLDSYLRASGIESINLDEIQRDIKKYLPGLDFSLSNSDSK